MLLDPDQQAAVQCRDALIVCNAAPASGKSRVIVERIKSLIAEDYEPDGLCVLSYTVAACKELSDRLGSIKLGNLSTLHGYCFNLLQRHGQAIGYRAGGISLIGESMADELFLEMANKLHWKGTDKALRAGKCPLSRLIYKAYHEKLKYSNLCTFDTVLSATLKLLETGIELPKWAEILVDEAADCSEGDWAIIDLIPSGRKFIVGDDDQSIFGWRGAYPKGFQALASKGTVLKLQRNYRSCPEICEAANRLISHNPDRIEKRSVPTRINSEGIVLISNYTDDCAERANIVHRIKHLTDEESWWPNRIAILCRTNALAAQFRDALKAVGVPVQETARKELPRDWSHAMNVLSLFNDPRSDVMAEQVIKRIRPDRLARIKSKALNDGVWMSRVAAMEGAIPSTFGVFALDMITHLPKWGCDIEIVDCLRKLFESLPIPRPTLSELIHACYDWAKNSDEGTSGDGVYCGSLHSSKAREWPIVFLPAWEEGIVPSTKADSDILEECRLAYVGITRAEDQCYISYSTERFSQWGTKRNEPSRFIKEIQQ